MDYIFSVGKNELPVYIAAKALLKPDDHALFLHSPNSAKEVGRIQKLLRHPGSVIPVRIEDAYDPESVGRKVQTLAMSGEAVHFHYSGGTKAMIVEIARRLPSAATFSYLDPAEHRIRMSPLGETNPPDQRRNIKISLKQLIELHGYEFPPAQGPPKDVKKQEMCAPPPPDIRKAGLPLELWTYHRLCDALRRCALPYEAHWSVKPTRNGREMEIDVVVVIGYQLVGISCANFGRGNPKCKEKAFEIWHRTHQLGGDVTRSILVCKLNKEDAERLEEEVRQDIGPSADSFQVWGNNLLCHDAPETALRDKFVEYLTALLRDPEPSKKSPTRSLIKRGGSVEHLLLTVGTSEIAVLAAADRLYRDSLESHKKPVITLLTSGRMETTRISKALCERIAGLRLAEPLIVNPYLPGDISAAIDRFREALSPEDTLRMDYTGGTKAMVVHAVAGLSTRTNRFSYLDVQERHLHGCGSGDLRFGWELDVTGLAKIHGHEARGISGTVTGLRSITPLRDDSWLTLTKTPAIKKRVRWPTGDWGAAGLELKAGCSFDDETWSPEPDQFVNFARISPDFPRLHSINLALQSSRLKLEAYEALRAAFVGRRPASVVHSVSVNGRAEIEVAGVLGYELLVLGCVDHPPASGYLAECKLRGFELLYRARQIGGDQIHAVLITRGSPSQVSDVLEDMVLDSGYAEPVHVWGASDLSDLEGKFATLLDSLKWGQI